VSATTDTRKKGPPVYLDYDQDELDAAYDQAVYAPNMAQITGRYVTNSAASRARLEYVEVTRTARAQAPIFLFLLGGAWRMTKSRYDFAAEMIVNAGAHFVAVSFTGIEEAGGDLMQLATQVRSAVAWTYEHAALFGGDQARLFVGGHSSGAHLAGVVVTTDWPRFGAPSVVLRGALCCSGMYDLEPVRRSKRSAYVHFDDAVVKELSAIRHIERICVPLVVAHGTLETPEFQRQGREFVRALEAAGKSVRHVVGEGYNHFELIETLGNPYGVIGRAGLELMHLAQ
jgi:arylformamidase